MTDALDLGPIEPGEAPGRRGDRTHHPWSPTVLDAGISDPLGTAVAEYYRLERAESAAIQKAYDLGEQRAEAAAKARALGWRG